MPEKFEVTLHGITYAVRRESDGRWIVASGDDDLDILSPFEVQLMLAAFAKGVLAVSV